MPGGGRGRGRGRGPGKWTAAAPSADFLASLQPVSRAETAANGRAPPPILGPVAPPPVPFHLAPVPPPRTPLPPQQAAFQDIKQEQAKPDGPSSNKSAAQILKERMLAGETFSPAGNLSSGKGLLPVAACLMHMCFQERLCLFGSKGRQGIDRDLSAASRKIRAASACETRGMEARQ